MKYSKNIILRFSIFAILLLLVIPLWFSTFLDIHYVWAIRASFFFLKIFKLAIISSLLLFFIVWIRINKFKLVFNWKQTILFGILTLLFFAGSFYTQQNMSTIVSEGVKITDETLNFDGSRWLGFSIIGDTMGAFYDSYIDEDTQLKKQVFLEESTDKIVWHGFWEDINGNNQLDSKIYMVVNNNSFEVTDKYSSLNSEQIFWFELIVPENVLLEGNNELIILSKGEDDLVHVTSQDIYQEANSLVSKDNGLTWESNWREFIWYAKKDSSFFYLSLFKMGFILKILGIITLFIAVFGLRLSKLLITTSYKELLFSTIFAYWVYWFSEFIKTKWEFFAEIVAKSLFWIFKITGFKVFLNLKVDVPTIGIQGFVAGVYNVCSGVDSMGFFTLAYFMLVVLNWKRVIFWRAAIMYIPGLIGIFILNILRVYVLIIIGAKLSSDFALNAFHTNAGMVFSVIYFIIFLPLALKVIEKKKEKK